MGLESLKLCLPCLLLHTHPAMNPRLYFQNTPQPRVPCLQPKALCLLFIIFKTKLKFLVPSDKGFCISPLLVCQSPALQTCCSHAYLSAIPETYHAFWYLQVFAYTDLSV